MTPQQRRDYYTQQAKRTDDAAWERGCIKLQAVAEHYKWLAKMDDPPVPF